MGFRILGAPTETVLMSLQGDVTLSLTPDSGLTFNSFAPVGDPPRLSDFDNFISTYGPTHASSTDSSNDWEDYDGDRVHRFLADYTGNTATYMPASRSVRDAYWAYACGPQGSDTRPSPLDYKTYPVGFHDDVVADGYSGGTNQFYSSVPDAFAGWLDDTGFTYNDDIAHYRHYYNREVSYHLLTAVMGERLVGYTNFNNLLGYGGSYPLDYRYEIMLAKNENHMRQWRNNDFTNPTMSSEWHFMTPFMVGITTYTLARYYDLRGNDNWQGNYWPDIPTAIEDMLTWMYNTAPNHTVGGQLLIEDYAGAGTYDCFPYADRNYSAGGGGGSAEGQSPDLNMLIAPSYAWLGKHYNDNSYINNMADRLFAGCAYNLSTGEGNWLAGTTKQYNQHFTWAQEYFTWRQQV